MRTIAFQSKLLHNQNEFAGPSGVRLSTFLGERPLIFGHAHVARPRLTAVWNGLVYARGSSLAIEGMKFQYIRYVIYV